MSDGMWVMLAITVVVGCAAAYVAVTVIQAGQQVEKTSQALGALGALNTRYASITAAHQPITLNLVERVNSKAKYDKFNLEDFLYRELDLREQQVEREISTRQSAVRHYATYSQEYLQLERSQLGKSTSGSSLNPERFNKIESRRFTKRKLRAPELRAKVTIGVTYQSPQGRNSYARSAQLSFEQLVAAMIRMRELRDEQNEFQRRRNTERAKMTDAMRVDVLRRDGHTCRFCGAKPPAVVLHVDHITPVSRGGLTEMSNLQTLCSGCNLGKSNRFSG